MDGYDRCTNLGKKNPTDSIAICCRGRELSIPPTYCSTSVDKYLKQATGNNKYINRFFYSAWFRAHHWLVCEFVCWVVSALYIMIVLVLVITEERCNSYDFAMKCRGAHFDTVLNLIAARLHPRWWAPLPVRDPIHCWGEPSYDPRCK
jgi:hypothetical protein